MYVSENREKFARSEDVLEKTFEKLRIERYDIKMDIEVLKAEEAKLKKNLEDLIHMTEVITKKEVYVSKSYEGLVKEVACDIFEVSLEDLESKKRHRPLIEARKFIWGFLKSQRQTTLAELGKMFNRDHATVINSLTDYDWLYENVEYFRLKCDTATKLITKAVNLEN